MNRCLLMGIAVIIQVLSGPAAISGEPFKSSGSIPVAGLSELRNSAGDTTPDGMSNTGAVAAFSLGEDDQPTQPTALIAGLAALRHDRDGTDVIVEVPQSLQMRFRAQAAVRPIKPKKGKLIQITSSRESPYASIGTIATGCSGTLVMKRFVLTAPWCVYDTKAKKFYENLDFVPGLNGSDAPVGSIKWKGVFLPKGFLDSGDLAFAFALIELEEDVGDKVGWFGFGPIKGDGTPNALTLTGYPFAEGVPRNSVWEANCSVDASDADAFYYRCPGDGGTLATMLGSPFFLKGKAASDPAQLLGIHINAQNDKRDSWWALKLTDAHTQTILAWANGGEVAPIEPDSSSTDDSDQSDGNGDGSASCTCIGADGN
jgi:V8-like Glu-specific endopeptidase